MKHHIIHHTKRAVSHMRGKPYETRMHIIRFLTGLCGLVVVLLWIALLKKQLVVDPVTKKSDEMTKKLFQEQVIRVTSSTSDNK